MTTYIFNMCGIFGYIGNSTSVKETIKGLKVLEYRGYDSAGVAFMDEDKIKIIKSVGDISKLQEKLKVSPITDICIGHTRWATNGSVSEENSHPHFSFDESIAVVHNGIIENYNECKKLLLQNKIQLRTDVDTEVIPNILGILQHNKHNIHEINNYFKGHYVFCACMHNETNSLFLAKNGNLPLFVGKSNERFYVTSDSLALPVNVTEIIALDSLDTCIITERNISFYHSGKPIQKEWQSFTQSISYIDKGGFATFMEKEINEIPNVINNIIKSYDNDESIRHKIIEFHKILNHVQCVHICACGTSYHAGLIIGSLIERYFGIRAKTHISSEFTKFALLNEKSMAIIISQSGETADTLSCMNILSSNKIPIVSLCNVPSSTIVKESTIAFPLLCGPEVAVASTKVFVATLLVGAILINKFKLDDFLSLSNIAKKFIKQSDKIIPMPNDDNEKIFFIGKGLDYFLSLESALKVKEVTYSHCEAYPASELKHGPLSMIDDKTLSVVYVSDTENAISEISARNGKVIKLEDPSKNNPLAFIVKIIPAQFFALRMATHLNINPDRPRNLAKSVTVL